MLKKEPQMPRPNKNYLRNPDFCIQRDWFFFIMKVFFIFKKNMLPNISGIWVICINYSKRLFLIGMMDFWHKKRQI